MIGKFLSKAVKVVTLPLDAVEILVDVAAGGDGSKESREDTKEIVPTGTTVRDAICEQLESIDDDQGG